MIKQLIFYYWRVTSFKESPENTPYSSTLFIIASVFLTLILTLQWHMISVPADYVMELVVALSLVCSFIGYTAFVLWSRGFSCRIVQTVTCLLMAHSFIHCLATPLLLFEPYLMQEQLNQNHAIESTAHDYYTDSAQGFDDFSLHRMGDTISAKNHQNLEQNQHRSDVGDDSTALFRLKNPLFLLIAVVYLFITLGLFIWQFVVTAHIYKFALSTTPVHSVIAALGLLAVNVLTLSLWR